MTWITLSSSAIRFVFLRLFVCAMTPTMKLDTRISRVIYYEQACRSCATTAIEIVLILYFASFSRDILQFFGNL